MVETKPKRQLVNQAIGILLGKLYEDWPSKIDLDYEFVTKDKFFKEDLLVLRDVFDDLFEWLSDNGFVSYQTATDNTDGSGIAFYGVTLTEKGLKVLDGMPPSLNGQKIGDALADAAKEIGKDAAGAGLAELVGQLLGGMFKGMVS